MCKYVFYNYSGSHQRASAVFTSYNNIIGASRSKEYSLPRIFLSSALTHLSYYIANASLIYSNIVYAESLQSSISMSVFPAQYRCTA